MFTETEVKEIFFFSREIGVSKSDLNCFNEFLWRARNLMSAETEVKENRISLRIIFFSRNRVVSHKVFHTFSRVFF